MKLLLTIGFVCVTVSVSYSQKNNVIGYPLPDSVKAISFLADIWVAAGTAKKESLIGIKTDIVKLYVEIHKKERTVVFEFPFGSHIMASGIGIAKEKKELEWEYNSADSGTYKLMIATAGDSAGNFALYSGYVYLPVEKKWKLIGTCKITGQWNTIKQPASFVSGPKGANFQFNVNEVWCQRQNGSWKNMLHSSLVLPVVNLYSHVDSLQQLGIERSQLEKLKTSSIGYKEKGGIYYAIIKEGTGTQVSINDTVVVHYKGYLFNDNTIFDQTKETPATFPLRRLITGWQIALQFCKVGGKVQVIIPSNLAYSIRTRAARIPPNSILVFEIEVVDVKSPG